MRETDIMKATLIIVWMIAGLRGVSPGVELKIEKIEDINFDKCLQSLNGLNTEGFIKENTHNKAKYLAKAYCVPHGRKTGF
jgi:hypothetical protein